MNYSAEKFKLYTNRSGLILALFHRALGIARQLIRFFTLTEEDRLRAGIYHDGEGHPG